jgi:hypothetical protein
MAQAERFLRILDAKAEQFAFQTIDDDETRKARALARVLHTGCRTPSNFRKRISSSGQVGVYRHRQVWRALIGENGQLRHIGYFKTKTLAAAAYRAAAKWRVRERAAALAKIQSEEDAAKRLTEQVEGAMLYAMRGRPMSELN